MKDVYRIYDNASGKAIADYIVRAGEQVDTNEPLELFHPVETWKRMMVENFSVRNIRETWIREGERLIYSKPSKRSTPISIRSMRASGRSTPASICRISIKSTYRPRCIP